MQADHMKPTWKKVYGPPFDPVKEERRSSDRLMRAWIGVHADPPGYRLGMKLDATYVKYRDWMLRNCFAEDVKRKLCVPDRFMNFKP